eukprot:1720767-Pleurochrysis_carterae.AAC.1
MENERNANREEPQPVAQVDNPREEPKACNHLMLYRLRPSCTAADGSSNLRYAPADCGRHAAPTVARRHWGRFTRLPADDLAATHGAHERGPELRVERSRETHTPTQVRRGSHTPHRAPGSMCSDGFPRVFRPFGCHWRRIHPAQN